MMTETRRAPASTGIDAAIADVEQELTFATSRARQLWKEAAIGVHPELQPAGYKLLRTVIHLKGASGHVLAATLEMDKSVISRQARMLEDWGLITIREDATDGRARILYATPYAIERVRLIRTEQRGRLHDHLKGRPEDEVRGFVTLLRVLNEGL
jgi:DNA-binding MarR family transcriptional regulator